MLQMIFMLTSILTMKLLSVLDSEFNLSLKEMAFAPYGNKKQRLACPFTQTPNSSCIETDHEEAVDCREWPLSE